ncbi:MAG TPA: hypothetical protein VFT85_04215 [Acidimicrobiia bacterium]|nr:hypothetical protein [Acidimicrobiia bacterium]
MEPSSGIVGQGNGRDWRFTASLGFVVLIGAAVRVPLLGQVMRNDEVLTATRFATDFGNAITNYSAPNNHILHTVLVNISRSVFGLEAWAIRLPALLFGLLLIVAVHWWIFSATGRRNGALFAAALVAGSSMLIEYSTVSRGYTMVAVAFVVLMELGRRLLVEASFRRWVMWVIAATAGLATVPVFALPLSAVVVWMLLNILRGKSHSGRHLLGQLVLAGLATLVLTVAVYTPAALVSGIGSIVDNQFLQPVALSELPYTWYRLTVNLTTLVFRDGVMAVAYIVLFGISVVYNRAIFGPFLTPLLGMLGPLALSLARMVVPPQRVWLFAWPLVLGMAGAAAGFSIERWAPRLASHRWTLVIALTVAAVMGLSTLVSGEVEASREGGAFHDAPAVAGLLQTELGPSDRVVVESHPRAVLDWYLSPGESGDLVLDRDFGNADRVFVVVYHPRPQDLIGVLADSGLPLSEFAAPVRFREFPETDVYVMERID